MEPHFDFVDDGTPEAQRKQASTKGNIGNNGQGLYEDHVTNTTDDRKDRAFRGDGHRALDNVTIAVENKNRSKDFGAHFDMEDQSPGANKLANSKLPSHETRSSMNTHWGAHQDSPESRGINIAGNGMGSRKGTEWSLFEESPDKKENAKTAVKNTAIKTEGDGMGGRKNGESFWDF